MIVTNQGSESEPQVTERVYEDDEPESSFAVEKATDFIYEVKLFDDFALVRLAMPDHQPPVQRIDLLLYAELFDEYLGDVKELRSLLFGSSASHILVKKTGKDGDNDRNG